jgi:hypothetical protein
MTKNLGKYVVVILAIILIGVGVWWLFFYDPYRPTAYIGYTKPYKPEETEKKHIDFPSYVMEVDLLAGEVVDRFPLSENVPRVKAVAVDPRNNLLYAGGTELVRHPERGRMPSKGIDVYDLGTNEFVRTIRFPSEETGEAKILDISTMRFNPTHEKIFVNNPLNQEDYENEQEQKNVWIVEPKTGGIMRGYSIRFSVLHILSPSSNYVYGFGIDPARRWAHSVEKETNVSYIKGKEKLLKAGGWQPDPKGKYEKEPYVLNYPEIWGTGKDGEVIEFYDRNTLKKLGELQLEKEGEKIYRASPPRLPDAVNKTQRYTVSLVWMITEKTNDYLVPHLKVIDMKKRKLVNTIQLCQPGEIRGMTYVDVY